MVAGDLVNTASRIQCGSRTGNGTRRRHDQAGSEAAIVYEDAGARAQGQGRATAALASGQSGRPASAARPGRRARAAVRRAGPRAAPRQGAVPRHGRGRHGPLVSVVGVGGIGKSRLAWEFEKYIDGLARDVCGTPGGASPTATAWRSGRWPRWCAAGRNPRGRGDELRPREAPRSDRGHIPDPAGAAIHRAAARAPPRTRGERGRGDQENLFAAGAHVLRAAGGDYPTVLVFEDIHWADSALLDFIEYMLDWSRDVPLFILTLCPAGAPGPSAHVGLGQAQVHLDLPRAALARRYGRFFWPGPCAGLPRSFARESSTVPRESPSMRSRPCGCSSTAVCSYARATPIARPARSRPWRCQRRCMRCSLLGSTD